MINFKIIILLSLAAYMPCRGGPTIPVEESQVLESFNNYTKEKKNYLSIPIEVLDDCAVLTMGLELRERVLESLKVKTESYGWAVLRYMSPILLNKVITKARKDDERMKKYQTRLENDIKTAKGKGPSTVNPKEDILSFIDEAHFLCNDIVGSFVETCTDGHCTLNYDYLRFTYVTKDRVPPVPKNIVLHLRREHGWKSAAECIEEYYSPAFEGTAEDVKNLEDEFIYEEPGN